ncbi:MAG: FHA domain-containing protein [Gaiellaceae bacterium]
MIEQLLLVFQALFLVLLYVFIWRVLRGANRDLTVAEKSVSIPEGVMRPPGAATPASEARLVVIASDSLEPGSIIRAAGAVSIGRSPENAVALPDDDFVSSRHARVEIDGSRGRVVDLDSRNGTFVNGERVVNSRSVGVDDVVRVGATELKLTR